MNNPVSTMPRDSVARCPAEWPGRRRTPHKPRCALPVGHDGQHRAESRADDNTNDMYVW
ncbi:hypothetical protein GOARA_043_00350 [Gordonia araii NBRC 100433]|uniref:Uncharacterized protein n=1 Tax=Gordonia araii NBRC 100433 TaxID=1073574 RepID=G7H1A0_9ACTN|nr:hypothetical protein [Gordonia araii]NNG96752.1 hypothetical protein [Gordonia araii NBRC 100433]GAB09560.1 hypothetical protein GOARA_043_00350 [Gordonia araii NBRC 100433]